MHRYTALLTIILLSSCVTQPVGKDVSVPGAPPKHVSIELAAQVEEKPFSAEELANPWFQSIIAQCESLGLEEGCRKHTILTKYLTQFVRTKDEKIFISVKLAGVETDRDYEVLYRWFDPDDNLTGRSTMNLHTPLDLPPNAPINLWFHFTPSDPATLQLGKWRVEVSVNGRVEGARSFEVVDYKIEGRKTESGTAVEIGWNKRFIAYDNGVVKDTSTGLEWIAGPDRDTTWYEAKSWVESLNIDGGGWRMPTRSELTGLYQKDVGSRNMTPLLKTPVWWVWSGETKGSSSAWGFNFSRGLERWGTRTFSRGSRGFAVRSRR